MEKTTDTIPGKGSIVIPTDLLTNVKMLHEFLYGTVDYQPSAKVQSIDSAIKAELGTSQSDSSAEQSGGALVRHRRIRIIIIVIIITAMAMIAVRKVQASRSRRKNR